MRQLGDGENIVAGTLRRALGIGYFEIQNAVHRELRVVARDADLARHIQRDFFERMAIGNAVKKGHENAQPWGKRGVVFAQPFHDVRLLLWHNL